MTLLDYSESPPRYALACYEQMRGDIEGKQLPQRAEAVAKWTASLALPAFQYRPLPQAIRFHQSQSRWRFLLGGNRSSKSFSLAMETVWAATGMHPWRHYETPNEGFYATTTWDKVGDTLWGPKLEKLLHGIPHETVWHNKQRNIPEMVFVRPKGKSARKFWSKIIFKAYEQGRESFQAVALRWIHNDEQFKQDIWIEENSRIGGDYALDIACAFTPIDPQPWLETQLTTDVPLGWDIFELPLDDNRVSRGGFIADDQIDSMIEMWPPEVRETRRNGKWGSYLGAIFQTFSREVHVVSQARELELFFKGPIVPPQFQCMGSIDWGGSNPFVFLWGCQIPWLDNDWYIFDEYYWSFHERGARRLEEHATEIKNRTKKWQANLVRTWADHDPTDAREMYHYGVPSSPAAKSDVNASIETVQTLLNPRAHLSNPSWPNGRPRLHIAARCVKLVQEIGTYRWKPRAEGANSADAKDEPLKKDDHSVDAARYLLHSEKPFDMIATATPVNLRGRYKTNF